MPFWSLRRLLGCTALALVFIILWDASGLDLPFARWFGSSSGFPLRSSHAFVLAFHEIPRTLSSLVVAGLLVGIFKPWGFLQRLSKRDRIQLVVSVLGAMLMITVLKKMNATSCPWDLEEFGGTAAYVSHWMLGMYDGGPGHCFPAGHASSAFGFLAGWFVIRRTSPELATRWLVTALVLGFALGMAQQIRGAHYMSHTLWTAFFCWCTGLLVDLVAQAMNSRASRAMSTDTEHEMSQ